ncbi:MAG: hypothetical protein ACRC7N_12095, partial [Clostridium sp.]
MKKILTILLTSVIILNLTTPVSAEIIDKKEVRIQQTNKFDNITFQEIESIFIKKLKNLDLKLDKGTQEYKEYLFNYLMGK